MSEVVNDNLNPEMDGSDGMENQANVDANTTENATTPEESTPVESPIPDTEVEAALSEETEETPEIEVISGEEADAPVAQETAVASNEITEAEAIPESEETTPSETTEAVTPGESQESAAPETHEEALSAIAEANAEESEDETLKGRHEIPMEDYDAFSMEQLVAALEGLVAVEHVMTVREHVEEVRKAFLSKFHHFIDEKRDEFLAENPDTTEDFHYDFPLKKRFDTLYTTYRDKKNAHFKSLQNALKSNLEKREALVEELKNVVAQSGGNIAQALKQLTDIRERWKNAGPIPKDKYNHVWNNYHFHLENFYDVLHLDREARDLEFKNNLEQKQRIIARVEELTQESDINKAFRELQDLHRIWKEDIGPVSKEVRESLWQRFSELTKQMHDKRESLSEEFRKREQENLAKKQEIIAALEVLATERVDSHALWVQQIAKVEALRNTFFATGKVPSEVNEATWAAFKTAVRNFNALKNSFYKDIKKGQNDNLSRKQALVARANELKDADDFAATTPIMKQIQEEWKTIGHVPRKFSDSLWKEFKDACNTYFDRLKESKKEENSVELEAFNNKKAYLEQLRSFELVGDHKTDLEAIKAHIEQWKSFGKVPFNRRHIEGKFNKILDALFEKLSASKKEGEMHRFSSKLESLAGDGSRKLDHEKLFIMRKIDEVQHEIFQLENNIQFFQNAKNNPIVNEVKKNIERHKADLATWKEKLKQINVLIKQQQESAE